MNASAKNVHKEKEKDCRSKNGTDPIEAAEEAGLRYVSENQPGYTRVLRATTSSISIRRAKQSAMSNGFCESSGSPFRQHGQTFGFPRQQTATSRRLGAMHESANSNIYHERWREMRDENKYERIVSFGKTLPKIRRSVSKDLSLPGLPRNKVLAAIVQFARAELHPRGQRRIRSRKQIVRSDDHARSTCGREGIEDAIPFSRKERHQTRCGYNRPAYREDHL